MTPRHAERRRIEQRLNTTVFVANLQLEELEEESRPLRHLIEDCTRRLDLSAREARDND